MLSLVDVTLNEPKTYIDCGHITRPRIRRSG